MLRTKRKENINGLYVLPSIIWLMILFVIPVLFILIFSFFERGTYGGVNYIFSLENFNLVFDSIYIKIFLKTILIAFINTILCIILGYPLAYYISTRKSNKVKNYLLMLIILPFWTNFLIRTFSWMIILGNEGLINTTLIDLGMINEPLELLFTPFAVQIGMLYNYLPFMILPIYASLEKIDKNIVLASKDLGANSIKTFFNIILPLSIKGLFVGVFLVFIPSLGEFIIPDLLGGAKSPMIGNIIKDQFLTSRNWPFGSALVIVVMALILITIIINNKTFKRNTF